MKHKLIIFLLAGITFLSTFGGVAALLTPGPNSAELETTPLIVADGSGGDADGSDGDAGGSGGSTDGNSWGG